jgi:hypothetical protein
MADYYPLISRAVEALTDTSPAMRQAVYDRARTALLAQLRSLDPPLSEGDITRERLMLDEAIDRVEGEHGRGDFLPEPSLSSAAALRRPEPLPEPAPPIARPSTDDGEGEGVSLGRERPRIETVVAPTVARKAGRGRSIVLAAVLLLVVGAIGVLAWYLRVEPSEIAATPIAGEQPAQPEAESKLAERMGGERAPVAPPSAPAQPATPGAAPAARADLSVAQRAVLYEENQADPQNPKITGGRTLWRLDGINAGQGQPLETAVRATVEVPGAGISMAMLIRRNTDPTLPASHTIELTFTTPGDGDRAVRDVGLLQLKNETVSRGTPLAGLPVPVKENLFLIGLSNLPADIERNKELLLNRGWVDLPIRFASGQRAILSFEKGVSGDQVIRDAFQAW